MWGALLSKNGTFFSKDSSLTKGVDSAYGHKALSHFWRGLQEGLDFMFAGTVIDMNVVLYHRFYLGFFFIVWVLSKIRWQLCLISKQCLLSRSERCFPSVKLHNIYTDWKRNCSAKGQYIWLLCKPGVIVSQISHTNSKLHSTNATLCLAGHQTNGSFPLPVSTKSDRMLA